MRDPECGNRSGQNAFRWWQSGRPLSWPFLLLFSCAVIGLCQIEAGWSISGGSNSHHVAAWASDGAARVATLVAISLDEESRRQAATTSSSSQKGERDEAACGLSQKAVHDQKFRWRNLFDGKELGQWVITRFGGEGEVTVQDGCIILGMGNPMTGITWTGDVPRDNYELELEAKRTSGIDFFATTTFPVGEEYCSFVVGGWAGTVVGLSSINMRDASENETTQFKVFEDNRWYRIRIRVSRPKIECWIDEEKLVDVPREGRRFSVRMECDLCRPLGIATWCTEAVIRNIRIRELTAQEVTDIAEGLR